MTAVALVYDSGSEEGPAEALTGSVGAHIRAAGLDVLAARPGDERPSAADAELVVVFGSDEAAYDDGVPWLAAELTYVADAIRAGTPVLGICFGGQLLARALGAIVARSPRPEVGWTTVDTDDPDLIGGGPWLEFHFDRFSLPPGATEVARTADAVQAFVAGPHLGLQFHPEITTDLFEGWVQEWNRRGVTGRLPRYGVDLDAWRARLQADDAAMRARAGRLFDAFWTRARQITPSQ